MKFTYYGHACFGIEVAGKQLLFDPFVSPNPKAAHIDLDAIPADYILVTHGHEDHVADVEAIGSRTGATIVSNFEVISWFGRKGLSNVHPLNHGGTFKGEGFTAKFVNAIHSSVLPDGTYGGNPGGFVVESDGGSFYVSGDTALSLDMKLIGEASELSFAVLCVGDNFTMGYADACKAAEFVGVSEVIGVHFDTFPPIEIDHAAAREAFQNAGRVLHLPAIGQAIDIG